MTWLSSTVARSVSIAVPVLFGARKRGSFLPPKPAMMRSTSCSARADGSGHRRQQSRGAPCGRQRAAGAAGAQPHRRNRDPRQGHRRRRFQATWPARRYQRAADQRPPCGNGSGGLMTEIFRCPMSALGQGCLPECVSAAAAVPSAYGGRLAWVRSRARIAPWSTRSHLVSRPLADDEQQVRPKNSRPRNVRLRYRGQFYLLPTATCRL
jgi:hypothetical protein